MKNTLICFLFLFTVNSYAQEASIQLTTKPLNTNKVILNELLQFYIQPQADNISFNANVRVVVERSNNRVLTLKSSYFSIEQTPIFANRIVQFNGANLQLVGAAQGFEQAQRSDFVFPPGAYQYCLELVNEEGVVVDRQCATFEQINPISFFLIYPFDEQKIEEDRPVFTWTPLLSPTHSNIVYRVRWVESLDKMDAQEAFFSKPDFYQISNIRENILPYKIEYPAFDKRYFYYWQVEAYSGRTLLAKSDVWEYSFMQAQKLKTPTSYVKIDLKRDSELHLFSGDFLSFEWENVYREKILSYTIINENCEEVISNRSQSLGTAKHGSNYFAIDVSDWIELGRLYTLFIDGEKNEYKLQFKKVEL